MSKILLLIVVSLSLLVTFLQYGNGFQTKLSNRIGRSAIRMEYIPDGLTKKEWAELKKKEEEELKAKGNLGVLGTTRFKSRSLQAWQEAGAKHLFPVNPNVAKYEERPYMQRRGGDWEGKDLEKKGLKGSDQGTAFKRLDTDNRYDVYGEKGLLNSVSIFGKGAPLPWTTESANAMSKNGFNPVGKQGARAVSSRKLSPAEVEKLKANLVKPIVSKKDVKPEPEPVGAGQKKKMFGLF